MWRSTFLSAYDGTCKDRSDRDACAAKIAWAQVKTKYHKSKDGDWVEKAEDAVVGPVSPVVDVEGTATLFGTGELGPGDKGTKVQRWRLEFARALANECRNSDHPVECARAKANAAVGNVRERSMDELTGEQETKLVERKDYDAQQRREMAKSGSALPDGSFPIANCQDVQNAVGSLGRTDQPRKRVVAHIRKRASDLGCRLTPALEQKMAVIERYLVRKDERAAANAVDFQHIANIGDTPIIRPDHYSSEVWRSLPESYRTVRGEAIRRVIERNYAQAVEDSQMTGWKPARSHYDPEEFYFSKRWPTGDPRAPEVVVRSVLVRESDSLGWHLRPISSFASGTLAEKMPAGIVRHIRRHTAATPLVYRGGPGSGHYGHEGRPGEIGGSEPGDAASGEAGRRLGKSPGPDSAGATAENQASSMAEPEEDYPARLEKMNLAQIAREIRRDWKKVNFGAVPYLEALGSLDKISDNYIMDSGASVVAYFLANANTWRGDTARAVKAELNRRLKTVYG